jgi:ATP-binding cassette subfamily B protein
LKIKFYKQQETADCGPACLKMVCHHYGRRISMQKLRNICCVDRSGTNLLALQQGAEQLGFNSTGMRITCHTLSEIKLPCILHWRQNHYVVLYKITEKHFHIADPADELQRLDFVTFKNAWVGNDENSLGTCLSLMPGPKVTEAQSDDISSISWGIILKYFYRYKILFLQLFIGLFVGTLLSLIAPFITQAVVDVGINTRDIPALYMVLAAQGMLFLGSTVISFIRSWVLLHITTRTSISILADFLIKLMNLPMSFFETKTTGDIMQRMNDQKIIESFLTSSVLNTLFSLINLLVFTVILYLYSHSIFVISILSGIIYSVWITAFLKKRRNLNYNEFAISSENQNNLYEIVSGMQDIKLNGCQTSKRWGWERTQSSLFNFKIKTLALSQYQQGGALFVNQAKNIIITFLSVKAVIDGQMTLGGMMAVQYIVGQVGNPIEQLLAFMQMFQDTKISVERLNDIHQVKDEDHAGDTIPISTVIDRTVRFRGVSFWYPGIGHKPALDNINFDLTEGKVTAIVGMSGSGKSTLIKLLLKFYNCKSGNITLGGLPFEQFNHAEWRSKCGTVLQDSYIFADTIENNITLGFEPNENGGLQEALRIANLESFVSELPFGLKTKIGNGGKGISQGQRQRLLIARAVYRNPDYLFFDEATNALDANNEKIIMGNLKDFFKGKTVLIVAHRLSTVIAADNIIVVDSGRIIEQGTHAELVGLSGEYYELVRNQLAIGA